MNTRLAVATHILTFIATQGGQPATSELIASSVNTNPALVRRLLSQLAKAGLTTSQMGSGGGALLACPADQITLLDVYHAIDDNNAVFALHDQPNPQCPVGRVINTVLKGRIAAAEQAMQKQLSTTTIADMASGVAAENRKRA
ncbi:Rrf2 family transcriptional regulator [Sinorhizobium americanum]|uniref:Rrf2 family transcriptional regulator, group III n=1 Tax=Sinorhizobium americanum TaxID=194963 RepID=A0A1L3LSU2_9HYPH|nr:Rrf2 family transcriptional regulator [Sinorhizobium americanum]APG93152.1 Rrf2 family transcriptional regulator, group III [Sinorhizobium americanum]OAP45742.1 Rrf2 family transcriptional regulator [Sinorhizobium americanum]